MERLTMTSAKGGVAFTFDLDITCEPSEARKILKLAEKLKKYEDAEEQGLMLWLPVADGSTVFVINYKYECKYDYDCQEPFDHYKCEEDIRCEHEYKVYYVREAVFNHMMMDKLGKTVFLTKEEAEQALKQMGE